MNISRILKFLVAGVVIGAILFFAGFGVLNLLKDKEPSDVVVKTEPVPVPVPEVKAAPEVISVNPPEIKVTTNLPADSSVQGAGANGNVNGQGTSSSPIKIKPLSASEAETAGATDAEIQKVAFGTLTLSTVNSINNQPINADFLIENSENIAIALVKDTASSTLSLPVGDYKITVSHAGQKIVRFLGVKDSQNGSEEFELDAPVLTGETGTAEVAGADTVEAATTKVTQNSPAIPATPNEAAKNSSSTEEATATTGVSDDNAEATATVEAGVESAESPATAESESQTTAASQASSETDGSDTAKSVATGGLRLSALSKQGKRPLTVSFYIQLPNGENVKNFKNVKTQQMILPAGKYQVTAKTAKTTLVKQVEVKATKGIHEIFLIPSQTGTSQQASSSSQTQENSSSTAASSQSDEKKTDEKTPGKLELFAQKASNNSALKSNFYVQQTNGKLVASKVYVDSIGYKLPPGKYKVVVRSTGYKNKAITLNVRTGQTRREVFKLEPIDKSGATQAAPAATQRTASTNAQNSAAATSQNTNSNYGGLTVNIVSASDGSELPADIVISKRDGTSLKRASGVASASFDLPPDEFLIRVTYGGLTTNQQVNVKKGQLAIKTISFDTQRMSRRERRRLRRERAQ